MTAPNLTYVGKNLLFNLEDNQNVEVRTGRYVSGKDTPDWSEWRNEIIHVQKHSNGEIACLGLKNFNWAEYDADCYEPPHKYHPYGVFLVEDYYMELRLI